MSKDVICAVVNNAETVVNAINKLNMKKFAGLATGICAIVVCNKHGDKLIETVGGIAEKLIDHDYSFEFNPEKFIFALKKHQQQQVIEVTEDNRASMQYCA